MKRILNCLAALALSASALGAQAQIPQPVPARTPAPIAAYDPMGDAITAALRSEEENASDWALKATLYHGSERGMSSRDSLGCKVVPMRTAAVDGVKVPRHSLLFIKETVGLPMPDGRRHDGYWYASDTGGAIHEGRIDLFTGQNAHSMTPLMPLNLATVTVAMVGKFEGCPKD